MEVSVPSSPRRLGEYCFSAPTSPSHDLSQFYKGFDDFSAAGGCGYGLSSAVPFDWEEKPGTPKSPASRTDSGDDFAFDVSRNYQTAPLSAEELFDGGLIRPLKPPPRLHLPPAGENAAASPRKLASHGARRMIHGGLFSPRPRSEKEQDPFTAAKLMAPASRREARSVSPIRNRQFPWEDNRGGGGEEEDRGKRRNSSTAHTVCSALSASAKGYRKWKLKDLFLFRSASEGRAAEKDPLKKYTAALRRTSLEISDSGSSRRGPVSAHEVHYTVNRAVSEDLKKKTFLPYKQGILGRLAFNPVASGFVFSRK